MSDRTAQLRENLPTVAAVVDQFAAAFGRSNFSVSYASEAGHVLGKKSDGNHPCHDCRHFFLKMVSPDGKRLMAAVPFSWMWKDPALITDQLIGIHARMAVEEKRLKEQERRRKARKIRQLTKLAKAGAFKDKAHGR